MSHPSSTPTIQLVNQQDDISCGIACLAMVSGRTYDEVLGIAKLNGVGMYPRDLDKALDDLGLEYDRQLYPEICYKAAYIVTVPSLNVVAGHHYVVFSTLNGIFECFDPQYKRDGKKYYARDVNSEGVQVLSYAEVVRIIGNKGDE